MVVRMRHTRSQTRQRRSHHALAVSTLSTCSHCKALHLPHHMCLACGWYNGREVMDLAGEKKKRDQRLKEKRDLRRVDSPVSSEPLVHASPRAEDEKKPKEKTWGALGAVAKRLKDESLSESSSGTK